MGPYCSLCQVNGEHVLSEGSSSNVIAEVTITENEHKLEIYSVGDSSVSMSYFPRFCPQCGSMVNRADKAYLKRSMTRDTIVD